MIHSAQFFWEHLLYIFQKLQNAEPGFQIFQIPDPKKSVLWPGDVFGTFLCPKKHQFVYSFLIFYKFGLIRDKS